MLYAVRFQDIDDPMPIRKANNDAHMAWLGENAESIVAAGPLRAGGADSAPIGALWLVRADDLASAERLIAADPFMKAGLRAKTEILLWTRGYPAHPVEI